MIGPIKDKSGLYVAGRAGYVGLGIIILKTSVDVAAQEGLQRAGDVIPAPSVPLLNCLL